MTGKVYLVGAGPGDPELLTLRALRLLRAADVILHDDLVSAEILALAPAGARLESVGKRCGRASATQSSINALLVEYARAGYTVVRLKGGDPSVFGRLGEEADALARAGIEFDCVPGVTAASAAAAAAGISLTDRRSASALLFVSGHLCAGKPPIDWRAAVATGATLVMYMPGVDYARIAARLIAAGASPETPCLVISQASRPGEQRCQISLGSLGECAPLAAPAILVIGEVARDRQFDVSANLEHLTECDAVWRTP